MVSQRQRLAAALACALLGVVGALGVSMEHAWGYDESMHAELPAARMAVALKTLDAGSFCEAILDCQQYPFAYPLLLGGVQLCTGVSEHVCRIVGRLLWALGCFGLFLLAGDCVRRMGKAGTRLGPAPWLALAFGALSPLAVHFSGTLFLETPFCVVAIFTLRAWLRRERDAEQRVRVLRELAAGAWLSLAFFTKFNYGVLLWLGLGTHLLFETAVDTRLGVRPALDRLACVTVIPALALAWWFLLPLPEGAERAAQHREAFVAFLQGNQGFETPWSYRGIYWAIGLTFTPRVLALVLVGALASIRYLRKPPVQVLWLVLLATGIPVSLHSFQLERFLLPVAVPLWALAALGLGGLLPTSARGRAIALLLLGPAVFLFPRFDGEAFADRFGPDVPPEFVKYRNEKFLFWMRDLSPGRRLETSGLPRAEYTRLVELIDDAVRPGEQVMWLAGGLATFSPAALQLALYQLHGDRAHFLRQARRKILITDAAAVDPGWSEQQLVDFAAGFDVVLSTRPPDLRGNQAWSFLERYRELLVGRPDWYEREIGTLDVALPPPNEERLVQVRLHAARRR